jgi:O-antigen/teichoic acid export membrane protein
MINETISQRNNRIAKNTLLLYTRMLVTMGVSLFSVRIVLNTLGVEDYGLYNVVGGVVALLSFLPGSMASATQRFFSHALGQRDQAKLNKVFGVNSLIYLGIGFIALFLLLTVGFWFLENKLIVPEARLGSLVSLFYFSVFTFVISVIKSPFMAIIIAHEDMKIYAYVAIVESILKLSAVILLIYLPGEKIVVYGFLLFIVAFLDTLAYTLICFRKYSECNFKNIGWDSILVKEIVGFTGWTLFGQLTTVARGAAITILLNQYFSPIVVAARAIAVNISSQSNMLAIQFNTSLYPPIIKSYAANEKREMYGLVINGSKATFFLMWILALPIYIKMQEILSIWLKIVPDYSVDFAKLALIETLIISVSLPIATAARAPGKMATYESILGVLQLSILFVSWLFVKSGSAPQSVFYTAIVVNLIMFVVRLEIVSRLTGLAVSDFLKGTLPPILRVVFVTAALMVIIEFCLPSGTLFLIIFLVASLVINAIAIYFLGLPESLRRQLLGFVHNKINSL